MELVELSVAKRHKVKKGPARRLRATGKIPGILYGHAIDTIAITVDTHEINTILRGHIGRNFIINLKVENDTDPHDRWTIIRELQRDPVSNAPLHIDLYELKRGEPIHVTVPIHLIGSPIGVKAGGSLEIVNREVEVKCLPKDIPEFVELNVDHLNIGDGVHISDLSIIDAELIADPGNIVAHVIAPRAEVEPTEEDEEVEGEGEEEAEESTNESE